MLSEKKKKNDDDIATLSAVSKATSKKYLDDTGLGHLSSLIISFVRNYASPKTHNHDGVYAKSSHAHTTSQVTGLDSALAGKADKGHTHDDRYYTESEANSKFSPIGGSASLNKLSENVTLGNGSAGSIVQNSGTYHQKFEILDDANAGTDTFVFSQSTDSGAKFTKLMSIRDDGNVVANKFTGALSGNAASASSVPWSGVAGKPSSFTPSSHTHDDRYYTESEVDSKLAGKAPSSHTHTIGNITNLQSSLDGKAAVSHGHSAATTSAAGFMSAADKSKLDGVATGANKTIVDSSLTSTSVNPVQNKVVNSALAGKASTSHTHTTTQVSGLDAALAGKAPSSHTHTIAQVTNLQTELDKKQVKIQPVTTAGTGSAYTATVSHIKALTAGATFTMIPNVVSTTVSPTLNVNGLGAKQLRQRLSNSTQSTATGATDNWLAAGKPVNVMYDGAFWVVDFVRPNMTSAYGTLPVANGGTGCTNSSDAASHLIDSLAVGATTATDNDYLICQVPNSGTAHKRPMSVVWSWVKAKCDSIYQPKGSYAPSSHTHNSIKDAGDGRDITFNYSADGAQDATWFAVWNGSELKSMSKQQMKNSLGISSSGGVNIGKVVYPVGAVYISWSSTSPAALFGGSWVAITGRFPYFNAGTSVGGSNTHTHTLNSGYAKITSGGSAVLFNYKDVNAFNTNWAVNGSANGASSSSVTSATTLGGNTDSNYHMPSYQTLYAWRRTA